METPRNFKKWHGIEHIASQGPIFFEALWWGGACHNRHFFCFFLASLLHTIHNSYIDKLNNLDIPRSKMKSVMKFIYVNAIKYLIHMVLIERKLKKNYQALVVLDSITILHIFSCHGSTYRQVGTPSFPNSISIWK